MIDLSVVLEGDQSAFEPGTAIRGSVDWRLDEPAEALEVRLIWFTEGRGERDVEIVESREFDASSPSGSGDFEFEAPDAPLSFSGQLITLRWAVELVALPTREASLVELVIAPGGREIDISGEPPAEG